MLRIFTVIYDKSYVTVIAIKYDVTVLMINGRKVKCSINFRLRVTICFCLTFQEYVRA